MEKAKKYKLEKLKSASDLEALILIYDELTSTLEEAKNLLAQKKKGAFQEKVDWAKKIIESLASILNFEINAKLAGNIYRIYNYLLSRLGVAREAVRQTPSIIDECLKITSSMRDSWVKVRDKGDITDGFKEYLTSQETSFLNIKI